MESGNSEDQLGTNVSEEKNDQGDDNDTLKDDLSKGGTRNPKRVPASMTYDEGDQDCKPEACKRKAAEHITHPVNAAVQPRPRQ
jgi:hypothetical protein